LEPIARHRLAAARTSSGSTANIDRRFELR
jgi:hypothetical protein